MYIKEEPAVYIHRGFNIIFTSVFFVFSVFQNSAC